MFDQRTSGAGGPNKIEKAKIGLIQFCISPPKTDVSYYLMSCAHSHYCQLQAYMSMVYVSMIYL